ncbi:MAG: 2-C-methyl-D-erythritol 2,4-cyclodiphosphate synthase [Porticoccaceae bacterium]|jgi:2-C-methyl-D-erythritol 2,4-cyclodiphosphate synthase|nr:2-C-methyl-D-erythritol 2,4-cyclodiphosphate synthase [Porticoccaceae bacterium]MBT6593257.1 2-C-methyl-D-erythritol 2,4-cyclodiphosphate synthase [Porticoccaceae bacterium]MDG1078656.1 2-C-methyl-D-erythritol 2,4-cyclodiphosphate synthase [Porticoccaceae bacterium]
MRIGHGYDVHRFGPGDKLILGGVSIPYQHSFVAHSDGDVLIHALIDALLGAAALGDIGQHFPDTDAKWQGANSRQLLAAVVAMIASKGYKLGNADITIVAQQPKMLPHLDKMRLNLAADISCNIDQINIKATTTEELGFAGRKEGIACHAVALLVSS